jgi:hypothetical protein
MSITSHFAKKPKKKAIHSLHQLRSAVDTAAERALAIFSERWPARHPSFEPQPGQSQSMNGGCGALWMILHGHSASYGVPAFNRTIWQRAVHNPKTGKRHTGKGLATASEAYRTSLIQQLRDKWAKEESELLASVPAAIAAAEVTSLSASIPGN